MNNQQIPEIAQNIVNNFPVYDILEKIGDTYGLLLDQLGYLDMHTREVLLGILPSDKYIETIASELEISNQTSENIAAEVNTKIFIPIKEEIRKSQQLKENNLTALDNRQLQTPTTTPPVAPIEKAGDFTLVKPPTSTSPIYKEHDLKREAVLADLEQIHNLQPENAESYVEHMLPKPEETPQKSIQHNEIMNAPSTDAKIPINKVSEPESKIPNQTTQDRKYTADPYREAI